jgi:ABC-type branched-subunit amino acid transport system substrate-binding protein
MSRGRAARLPHSLMTIVAAALVIGGSIAGAGFSSASVERPTVAKAPYTIGLDVALSGPLAPYSEGTEQFFLAYIDYANSQGGVDGHHIKVITLDDKGDPGQTLLNFEQLWSQDHVLAISGGSFPPSSYIQQNQIPFYTAAPPTSMFGKHYTTTFTTGSQLPAWSAQTAYWIVKILHRPVKRVAVIESPSFDAGFAPFIKNYWTKLGATFIDVVPDQGPSADCSSYILKFKSEGIQYLDEQGLEGTSCILAESRLAWKPQYGQGGPLTSEIGEAELVGKPYIGVVAGSPNTLYTGQPIYSSPSAADRTYVGNIRKYYPTFANYNFLNGTDVIQFYGTAELMVAAMKATLTKFGKVTSPLLNQATRAMTSFDDGLEPVVASFQPSCKTGGDATIWGFWHYNPKPTASKPRLYMVPTSGPNWITNDWLHLGKCYLSNIATNLFPNG